MDEITLKQTIYGRVDIQMLSVFRIRRISAHNSTMISALSDAMWVRQFFINKAGGQICQIANPTTGNICQKEYQQSTGSQNLVKHVRNDHGMENPKIKSQQEITKFVTFTPKKNSTKSRSQSCSLFCNESVHVFPVERTRIATNPSMLDIPVKLD
jgi:hypothetical protein